MGVDFVEHISALLESVDSSSLTPDAIVDDNHKLHGRSSVPLNQRQSGGNESKDGDEDDDVVPEMLSMSSHISSLLKSCRAHDTVDAFSIVPDNPKIHGRPSTKLNHRSASAPILSRSSSGSGMYGKNRPGERWDAGPNSGVNGNLDSRRESKSSQGKQNAAWGLSTSSLPSSSSSSSSTNSKLLSQASNSRLQSMGLTGVRPGSKARSNGKAPNSRTKRTLGCLVNTNRDSPPTLLQQNASMSRFETGGLRSDNRDKNFRELSNPNAQRGTFGVTYNELKSNSQGISLAPQGKFAEDLEFGPSASMMKSRNRLSRRSSAEEMSKPTKKCLVRDQNFLPVDDVLASNLNCRWSIPSRSSDSNLCYPKRSSLGVP